MARGATRILAIDDSPTILLLLETALGDAGFEVHQARSGLEGLRKARAIQPDVIVLDIIMPGMNGLETLRHLRRDSSLADTPVLIVAKPLPTFLQLLNKEGVEMVIHKPFCPERLLRYVRSVARPKRPDRASQAQQ